MYILLVKCNALEANIILRIELRNFYHFSARLRELIINKKKPEFVGKLAKGEIEKGIY